MGLFEQLFERIPNTLDFLYADLIRLYHLRYRPLFDSSFRILFFLSLSLFCPTMFTATPQLG